MPRSLIQIQDEFIETVNAGIARWSHRHDRKYPRLIGGHADRIVAGAGRRARKELRTLGFTEPQIDAAIRDASDMAELRRRSEQE
jgi:hypothetical protein